VCSTDNCGANVIPTHSQVNFLNSEATLTTQVPKFTSMEEAADPPRNFVTQVTAP
jgi:invasion protein IalB